MNQQDRLHQQVPMQAAVVLGRFALLLTAHDDHPSRTQGSSATSKARQALAAAEAPMPRSD